MREPNLTIFAVINSSLISAPVLVVAIIALAIILSIGGVFIWRSGKNKPTQPPLSMNGTSDWQRQAQPGSAGGWNPQGQAPQTNWNAPNAAAQQNSWGGAGAPQQQQAWGGGTPSQPSWGGAPAGAQQPWGNQPAQPEQPQWGNNPTQQPAAGNPWGASSPQQPQQWGNQPGGAGQAPQAPWEATPAAAPVAQDPWGQPQPVTGQQWGAPQQPQAPAAGWGQPQTAPADPWGATPKPQSPPAGPFPNQASAPQQWQQGQAGYGQDPNATYAANADSDKTMLRAPGQQTGSIGYVRVEEGKEPGRIYEIKKESLSMGRSRESDIFLEDLAVSRLHASLVNMGNGSYALKDEGSANGTKVNGQLVNKFQTYPLQEGDRIQLGQTVLAFAKK